MLTMNKEDLRGRVVPESWLCVDCGTNTAPGLLSRLELEAAVKAEEARGVKDWEIPQRVDDRCEIYAVRDTVWKAAGMEMGGCLCVGCLERRLGRRLRPRDFLRDNPFNKLPGTPRLMRRRKDRR